MILVHGQHLIVQWVSALTRDREALTVLWHTASRCQRRWQWPQNWLSAWGLQQAAPQVGPPWLPPLAQQCAVYALLCSVVVLTWVACSLSEALRLQKAALHMLEVFAVGVQSCWSPLSTPRHDYWAHNNAVTCWRWPIRCPFLMSRTYEQTNAHTGKD